MEDISIGQIPDTSILVGSNALVYVDDKAVAYMDDVDIDENYNQTDIRAIGDFNPKDIKALFFEGSFSCKLWIITDNKDPGKIKLPDMQNILTTKGHLVEFREKSTGKRIMRVIAKLNTQKTNIGSTQPSSRNCSFKIVKIQHMEAYN